MSETIYFNTGRCYTKAGQRITATRHDDGVITFMDHDRMIPGELTWGRSFSASSVLAAYDAGDYKGSNRASADGMQRGGCNTSAEKPAPAPQPAAPAPAKPAPKIGDRVTVRPNFGKGEPVEAIVVTVGEKNFRQLIDYEDAATGLRRWAYLDQVDVITTPSNEQRLGDMLFKIMQQAKRPRDGGSTTPVPIALLDEASELLASMGR